METFSVKQFIDHFRALDKTKVTFFCGAGVSMSAPSFAPNWIGLRDLYLTSLFDPLIDNHLLEAEDAMRLLRKFKTFLEEHELWLKPEVVLHWLYSRFGDRVFEVLEVLNYGTPNANHYAISDILAKNTQCKIVTTNFDLYFERAFSDRDISYKTFAGIESSNPINSFREYLEDRPDSRGTISLLKLHGTTQDISSVKATIQQVSKTPEGQFEKLFESFMKDRHLIVMGYSGNDYDIFPLLKKFSKLSKSISWFSLSSQNQKKEISTFECSVNQVFGNLNELFQPKPAIDSQENLIKGKVRRKFQHWSKKLSVEESGYTLCLIGMHTGFFELTKYISSSLLDYKLPVIAKTRIYNVLGIINKRSSPESAIKFYKKGIKSSYHRRYTNPRTIANLYGNMGALYHEIGNQNKAIKYLKISNNWANVSNSKFLYYSNLDDIGNCLREKKQYSEAIQLHNKCIRYFRANGSLIELSHSLNNKGLAYMASKKYGLAEKLIEEALNIKINETAELASIIRGYKNLGELRFLRNDYVGSSLYFIKAYRLVREFDDLSLIPEILVFLAYNLKQLNHFKISKSFWEEYLSKKHYMNDWQKNLINKEILNGLIYELEDFFVDKIQTD